MRLAMVELGPPSAQSKMFCAHWTRLWVGLRGPGEAGPLRIFLLTEDNRATGRPQPVADVAVWGQRQALFGDRSTVDGCGPTAASREALIHSGRSRLEGEMCRFKGRTAGQIAGNSCSIAKICNDEAAHFSPKMHVHEWIRGSLD